MSNEEKNIKVIKVDINKNDKLYEICLRYGMLAKDLYNYTNYIIRQLWITSKRINEEKEVSVEQMSIYNELVKQIDFFNENTKTNKIKIEKKWGGLYIGGKGAKSPLKAMLKDTMQFKALPSTASNEVIDQVVNMWNGYFESMATYVKDKTGYKGLPKPPAYKNKEQPSVFVIDKNTTMIKDGVVSFKKQKGNFRSFEEFNVCNINIPLPDWEREKTVKGKKVNLTPDGNLVYIRVVPKNNKFTLEFLYKDNPKLPKKEQKGRYIGIDLGIDRLATVSNSIGEQPFCINGKPLKSINKKYNKDIAHYKSVAKLVNNVLTTNRIKNMNDKRNARMETYIHQASSYIINWCLKYDIDTIVVGKNVDFKYKAELGKETQTFVQIPMIKFIDKLKYKAEDKGINFIEQDESYTSKASFIDNDYIPTYGKDDDKAIFSGWRIKRGLYQSKDGVEMHADLNGAYNIIRKYDDSFTYNENCKLHPYIIKPNISVA